MEACFSLERRVLTTIRREALLRPGGRAIVAASGGADSTALVGLLQALSALHGWNLELTVAHVNHRLRGAASDRDALAVTTLARSLGLPVILGEHCLPAKASGNLEARARVDRYSFLRAVAHERGAEVICVAHTAEDQAETVLQRLARGAGPAALGGMRYRRADGIVRPLLAVRRAECVAYLGERGLVSVQDASNQDETFFRNRVRHRVLPALAQGLGVDIVDRLARLAGDLQIESTLAERWVERLLHGSSDGDLPTLAVRQAGSAGGRLIHSWLARQGHRASSRQMEAVVRLASGENPSAVVDLGHGWRVARRYDVLEVRSVNPGPSRSAEVLAWSIPGAIELPSGVRLLAELRRPAGESAGAASRPRGLSEERLMVDPSRVGSCLSVRTPRPGDRIRLRAGSRKLKDVLIDARVPRIDRSSLAVVTDGTDILWVPGVVAAASTAPCSDVREVLLLRVAEVDCRARGGVVKMQGFRVRFA